MTTTRRNTRHMPTNFDPMAYDFIDAFDAEAGDPGARGPARQTEEYTYYGVTVQAYSPVGAQKQACLKLLAGSPTSAFRKGERGTQCDHCGAHLRYVCVLQHRPTGDYICVGETCLDNRVGSMDRAQWKVKELREAAARIRQAEANRAERDAFMAANPALAPIFARADAGYYGDTYAQSTITDIARKLLQYPSLSDRQVAFVIKLDAEHEARARAIDARMAQEATETKTDAPVGRFAFRGTIVFSKVVEGDWGMVTKLLIKVEDATGAVYKVWVSRPTGLDFERFDTVEMTATLKRSDRDASFAFGSRPSNARITGHNDNAVVEEMDDAMSPMVRS